MIGTDTLCKLEIVIIASGNLPLISSSFKTSEDVTVYSTRLWKSILYPSQWCNPGVIGVTSTKPTAWYVTHHDFRAYFCAALGSNGGDWQIPSGCGNCDWGPTDTATRDRQNTHVFSESASTDMLWGNLSHYTEHRTWKKAAWLKKYDGENSGLNIKPKLGTNTSSSSNNGMPLDSRPDWSVVLPWPRWNRR